MEPFGDRQYQHFDHKYIISLNNIPMFIRQNFIFLTHWPMFSAYTKKEKHRFKLGNLGKIRLDLILCKVGSIYTTKPGLDLTLLTWVEFKSGKLGWI